VSDRPTFAFLGDLEGPLAFSVAGSVRLLPFEGGLGGAAGLLSDAVTAELDPAVAAEVLASGAALCVARPSERHREILRGLAGHSPAAPVPLVSYRVAPGGGFAGRLLAESVTSGAPDVGAELQRLAAGAGGGAWSVSGFVPPGQSSAGYASYITVLSWAVPYPQGPGGADDAFMGTTTQQITSDILTEFFVFWANGQSGPNPPPASGLAPYFLVIVRESGPLAIGAGSPPFSTSASRGYFQLSFVDGPVTFAPPAGGAGSGVVAYSPTTQSLGQLALGIDVPLALWGAVQEPVPGVGSAVATLSYQPPPADFSGWGVLDQSSPAGLQWNFHQVQGWDPTQVAPGDASLLASLFDANGAVIAIPSLSLSSVGFQTLSAWQFSVPGPVDPGTAPPASYVPTYATTYGQQVALAHGPGGCKGAFGQPLRHVFTQGHTQPVSWTPDLGAIVALNNYPQPSGE
jgi:hypothetical protein